MTKLLSLILITLIITGCGHLEDAVKDHIAEATQPPPSVDAVPFSSLQFKWGGFNGLGAQLDVPRVANLNMRSNGYSFTYTVDLSSWGKAHHDHTGALACLFVKQADGQWLGGKHDWISSSRTFRDYHNIHGNYHGWPSDAITTAHGYAFVIISADGRKRSNVIYAEGAR